MSFETLPKTALMEYATLVAGATLYFSSACRTRADDFRFFNLLDNAHMVDAQIKAHVDILLATAFSPPAIKPGEHHVTIQDLHRRFGRGKADAWAASGLPDGVAKDFLDYELDRQRRVEACAKELKGLKGPIVANDINKLIPQFFSVPVMKFRQVVRKCVHRHFPPLTTVVRFKTTLIDFTCRAAWRMNACDADELKGLADTLELFGEVSKYLELAFVPIPMLEAINPQTATNYAQQLIALCDSQLATHPKPQEKALQKPKVKIAAPPPLMGTALEAAKYIRAHPGTTGDTIARSLSPEISGAHFRKEIVPKLMEHGFYNVKGGEGYFPPAM